MLAELRKVDWWPLDGLIAEVEAHEANHRNLKEDLKAKKKSKTTAKSNYSIQYYRIFKAFLANDWNHSKRSQQATLQEGYDICKKFLWRWILQRSESAPQTEAYPQACTWRSNILY